MHMITIGFAPDFWGSKLALKVRFLSSKLMVFVFSVGHWVYSVGLNFQSVTHAKDERAKKLRVPPRTLWSNDHDPV